jgi:two-component system sensor histidine kinase KdpD
MRYYKNKGKRYYHYILSLCLVSLVTVLGWYIKKSIEPTNIVMLYLLIIICAAILWGAGPAILMSVTSVVAFDYFLVPPYFTMSVNDIQYVFTFAVFLIVGITISAYASKMKDRAVEHQTEKLHAALLSSISHDLKTPLASITGTLTALLESTVHLDDRQKKDLLNVARGESARLNRFVDNLLDMTKMEAGVLRLNKKPCDLRDFIGACLEQLREKIGARSVKIDIPKEFPEIKIDFTFMLKAFFNIIDNAIKYSPDGSPIEIRAFRTDDMANVEIQDYGIGIAGDDLKKIFGKFYRVEKAENVSGTGLGLCISKGIVEAHNGVISVVSAVGKGSIFTITIP